MLSTDKSGHERGMKPLIEYYVKTRKSRRVEGSVGTAQNRISNREDDKIEKPRSVREEKDFGTMNATNMQ